MFKQLTAKRKITLLRFFKLIELKIYNIIFYLILNELNVVIHELKNN